MDMNITEMRKVLRTLAGARLLSAFCRRHKLPRRTVMRAKKKGWQPTEETLTALERAIVKDCAKGLIPKGASND